MCFLPELQTDKDAAVNSGSKQITVLLASPQINWPWSLQEN